MTATRADIERWFDEGKAQGYEYMIILRDNFDHANSHFYVEHGQDVRAEINKRTTTGAQGTYLEEAYYLEGPKEYQLKLFHCVYLPGSKTESDYHEIVEKHIKSLEARQTATPEEAPS